MRTVSAVAAGAATLFTLTACFGGGNSGTYYSDGKSEPIARLVIDGDDVTFDTFRCNGDESHNHAQGVLSESGDTVSWTDDSQSGRYEGTDPFIVNSDGDVVTVGKTTFSKEGSDAAQKLIDDFEELCTKRNGDWQSPL